MATVKLWKCRACSATGSCGACYSEREERGRTGICKDCRKVAKDELYNDSLKAMEAMGVPFPQKHEEFRRLHAVVKKARAKVFVEIGTRHGGSMWMLGMACPEGSTIISIDLPNHVWGKPGSEVQRAQVAEQLRANGRVVHLIDGDSTLPETVAKLEEILGGRSVDFLFIDGDHRWAGVLRDWELYHEMVSKGGMVAFHDILEMPEKPRIKVFLLWKVLKTIFRAEEYLVKDGLMGIGVIWK